MSTNYSEVAEGRQLTAEEMQKSVERLSRRTREPVVLKPLVETKHISQADLDKRIKHLYDDSLERRQRERDEVEHATQLAIMKDAKQTASVPLSTDEEAAMVHRLYEETLERKKATMQALDDQERTKLQKASSPKKKTKEEKQEITDRLYKGGMQREHDKRVALYEKYVVARRPEPVRRTADELAMSADKMTKGEGLTS